MRCPLTDVNVKLTITTQLTNLYLKQPKQASIKNIHLFNAYLGEYYSVTLISTIYYGPYILLI